MTRRDDGAFDDEPVLDADGEILSELEVDRVDDVAERLAAVVDQVSGRRQWRFGHVIVDEAQDLTPMQWRMVTRRTTGGSMTIVGDLAQRSAGPATSWRELLPAEISHFTQQDLTVNYRSPAEVNDLAAIVLASMPTGATPSVAIRRSGVPVTVHSVADGWTASIRTALDRLPDRRRTAVIHADGWLEAAALVDGLEAVDLLGATESKGLEFDDVVLVEPSVFDLGSLYVGLTRATRSLAIVHRAPLPSVLADAPDLVLGDGQSTSEPT